MKKRITAILIGRIESWHRLGVVALRESARLRALKTGHCKEGAMHIEAIWVRRIGDKVQVLFESLGKWHLVIEEHAEGPFSHIAEHPALKKARVVDE
jgi:hypothetical protein